MNGWFAFNISWRHPDEDAKQGFTRRTKENHNILRVGPLCIAFGIEGVD